MPKKAPSYKKSPRLLNDQYFTPAWMTLGLLMRGFLSSTECPIILEPTNGDGGISRIINREISAHVLTNDLFPRSPHEPDFRLDATLPASWDIFAQSQPDFTVGNPPFEYAFEIVKHAYACSRLGVAFILRLSFAEPTVKENPRDEWLAAHPFSLIVMPRHKWRKDRKGTDSVTSAWFLWDKTGRVRANDTITRAERDYLIEVENHAETDNRQSEDARHDPRSTSGSTQSGPGDLTARRA